MGYELIRESAAGSGSIDLRASAPLNDGGIINICIEAKNAHSPDLIHGLTEQLPSYMKNTHADYGIYLVLWYQCESFPEPKESSMELTLNLTNLKPWENIVVEKFDLGIPLSPSDKRYKYE